MVKEKIDFEQFLESIPFDYQSMIQDIHYFLLAHDCKVILEEKKRGVFASYKYGKPKKALVNILNIKEGVHVRIYGECADAYLDFLNTLPKEMVQTIESNPICNRLVHNTCSPKCSGYDVVISNKHYQKCRYGGFEFLIKKDNASYINLFIYHELRERKN